jgi:signal transduction histidine kinase
MIHLSRAARLREGNEMRVSLRIKILAAILAVILASDLVATWVVNDRLLAGAQREAESQARAETAQVTALYAERAATLAAEGEAISLYPAVLTALVEGNSRPLIQWSSQVTALQGTSVTVTDASGRVIARGHAPAQVGDDLKPKLAGLRMAMAGHSVTGVETGDELGLALRGFVPVLRQGSVLGVVMIADPVDVRLLRRLAGPGADQVGLRLGAGTPPRTEVCDAPASDAATCRFPLLSPAGQPVSALVVTVPLDQIASALVDAQKRLWLAAAAVLAAGALLAWVLARSLARPLARLTGAAGRVAAGAYEEPVGVRGSDEIGELARAFDTMRQQVARSTGELRRERDVLSAVLEAADDGILLVDGVGEVLVANDRWAAVLGGSGLAAAASLSRADGVDGTFAEAARAWLLEPGRALVTDFERRDPYRRFRCYTAPVLHRDATPIGRIFVLREVTWESQAERLRTALVATVSHELRAPLTTIAGYAATLLQAGPWAPEAEREMLEIVAQSAATLGGLVDNLLDAATMEAGDLRLQREPVRLERLAQRLAGQRQRLAPAHFFVVEAEPGLPLADADPARIEQVVANLVENAIKYSPRGGPINLHIYADAEGMLSVSVSDRGIGIAPEHAERLFERFYRADSDAVRSTKGVGLGLFICRRIVEAHGGRIWVASSPGAGSTFAFTVPRLADAPERRDQPDAQSIAGGARRLTGGRAV